MGAVERIDEIPTEHKVVAMTFDDGPNPDATPELLDIFGAVSGQATFYMVGEQMQKSPELVKAVAERGHEIGNHSFSHPHLPQLGEQDVLAELERTDRLIRELSGQAPQTFRPPYLDHNEETQRIADRFQYRVIGAVNTDSRDWSCPGVDHIVETSRRHVRNGSILIYHDGFENRSQTVEAVRQLVAELTEQGYRFVTVSELLRLAKQA